MKFKHTTEAASETIRLMVDLCGNESMLAEIEKIAELITDALERGGKVLICGNGGSGSDALKNLPGDSGRIGGR
jgi:phosphoheptose isomerase